MERIDLATWERREVFEIFSAGNWPFVSVTIPVDVTDAREFARARGLSFYMTMVWLCTKALNAVPEFRVRVRGDEIVRLDRADPSFTDLVPGSRTFKIVTLPWEPDLEAFAAHAKAKSAAQSVFMAHDDSTDELIYFSCTPWFDFTGLTGERSMGKDDTIPRVTWGKYFEDKGRLWVHLALEFNHRTVDGFHVGEFKRILDEEIKELEGAL